MPMQKLNLLTQTDYFFFRGNRLGMEVLCQWGLITLLLAGTSIVQAQLTPDGNQVITQTTLGLDATQGDRFGQAFAVGDFNNDSWDDVAISASNEDVGAVHNAGAVSIVLGAHSGLGAPLVSYLYQSAPGVDDSSETNDHFGFSLAACDFDGNNIDDLAVGVPGENHPSSGSYNEGAVHVFYTVVAGPSAADDFFFQNDISGSANEFDDSFGRELACGDFDHDGYDDLAVGSPREDWFTYSNVGWVDVIYGSASGLNPSDTQSFSQGLTDLGDLEEYDRFGWTLEVGDFDNDTYDDLVVGSIGEDDDTGVAHIIYGGVSGLDNIGADTFTGVELCGGANTYEEFAHSLAVGDFNDDEVDDLAVGVPKTGGESDSGQVCVLQGGVGGPTVPLFSVIFTGVPWQGNFEIGAEFGYSMTFGDFNRDGFDDLAISAPWVDTVEGENTGIVWIYHGSEEAFDPFSTEHYYFVQSMVGGVEGAWDVFGQSLAAGNFGGDSADDLLIGVPWENSAEGWVHEIFGRASIFIDGFESGDTSSWSSANL